MKTTGVREVRLSLSRLLRDVKRGEEILITQNKVPVARLVPVHPVVRPPLESHAALRAKFAHLNLNMTQALLDERDER